MAEQPGLPQPDHEPTPSEAPRSDVLPPGDAGLHAAAVPPVTPDWLARELPPPAPPPPPRPPTVKGAVGVVLLGLLVGFVLAIGAGLIIGFVLVFTAASRGQPFQRALLGDRAHGSLALALGVVATELGMLLVLFWALRRQPEPWREQVGWRPPGLSGGGYLLVLLATLFCGILGQVAALPISLAIQAQGDQQVAAPPGNEVMASAAANLFGLNLQTLRAEASATEFILFVLAITLPPGLIEELMLRGYAQRRLLRCVRPVWAVGCSAVLFAVVHIDPVQALFALPIGIWLGIVAWRTGSIWPGIISHMSLNAIWNIGPRLVATGALSPLAAGLLVIVLAAAGLVALVVLLVQLWEREPPMPAGASRWNLVVANAVMSTGPTDRANEAAPPPDLAP